MNLEGIEITQSKHAGFKINHENKVIYIDPFLLEDFESADYVFITHEHKDHLSIEDLKKIVSEKTVIVTILKSKGILSELKCKMIFMKAFEKKNIDGIGVETVPTYNTNKFRSEGVCFHPKEDGKVGFILTLGNKRIYHAGDTDVIPEMNQIKDIDIALIPVSGTYVMTDEEAIEAVKIIKPKVVVPMHYYEEICGSIENAKRFKELCSVPVIIMGEY